MGRVMLLHVNAVLEIIISHAIVALRPNQLLIDPNRNRAASYIMVHVQLKPFVAKIGSQLSPRIIVNRSAVTAKPKQHKGRGTVRMRLFVAGMNLKDAVAVLVGRGHL